MDKNSTQNTFIAYLYHETSAAENHTVHQILEVDMEMNREFQELATAHRNLPKAKFSPSTAALQTVLNYSRMTAPASFH